MESLKIVLVETSEQQHQIARNLINTMKYELGNEYAQPQEVRESLEDIDPDLLIIHQKQALAADGKSLLNWCRSEYPLPILYLRDHGSDPSVQANNSVFLEKPIQRSSFFRSLEQALFNFPNPLAKPAEQDSVVIRERLYMKDGRAFKKISLQNILWIESDGNYKKIYNTDLKIGGMTRTSMDQLENELPAEHFQRVHRSFIVNTNYVDRVYYNRLSLKGQNIPVGRGYTHQLKEYFKDGTA